MNTPQEPTTVEARIIEVFGVLLTAQRTLLFEIGYRLTKEQGLRPGKKFWALWRELWVDDDQDLLGDPHPDTIDYRQAKLALLEDKDYLTYVLHRYNAPPSIHRSTGLTPQEREQYDHKRKMVMAAIGGYLSLKGAESSADIIKGIACRASGYADFSRIPLLKLSRLYGEFCKKQKAIKETQNA